MTDQENIPLSASRLCWGMILIVLCILLVLSFYSYDWRDISILHVPPNKPPANLIGPVGAWTSFVLLMLLGIGAYFVPLWCMATGVLLLTSRQKNIWPRILASLMMMLALAFVFALIGGLEDVTRQLNIDRPSGILGRLIMEGLLIKWLSNVGAGIVISTLFVISLIVMVRIYNLIRFYGFIKNGVASLRERIRTARLERQDRRGQIEYEQKELERQRRKLEKSVLGTTKSTARRDEEVIEEKRFKTTVLPEKRSVVARIPDETKEKVSVIPPKQEKISPSLPVRQHKVEDTESGVSTAEKAVVTKDDAALPSSVPKIDKQIYTLPPLSLLHLPESTEDATIDTDAETASRILVETLSEFGIEVSLKNVERGPTVTRYELEPAPGVRVERISSLSNNLALSLKASSVRVQAPVPGKGVVGIEVPNSTMRKVYLKELLEGETWQSGKAKLPLALGKDVGGSDLVADLAEMPHLLVAGATGSGKTVCINSILAGLLISQPPSRLRLLLVDPKIVEFSVYNNIPHLVVPVVTDPKKVAIALRWAINEMEKRYKLFAKVGVRNIESYNNREKTVQSDLFNGNAATPDSEEKQSEFPPTVPYIVIVIDELADLMLVDQAEIENCIARLAQLSRAVGIHMILSTQRPSVNVITGTIKANFPARIAFQVAQKVDSRTILDTIGAEKLLGRGDMLFAPSDANKPIRGQAAFVSVQEIAKVAQFIKHQRKPEFHPDFDIKEDDVFSGFSESGGEDSDILEQAIKLTKERGEISTSYLQRKLGIGYSKAARLIDEMEARGLVTAPDGNKPRKYIGK